MGKLKTINQNYLFQRAYRSKTRFVSPFVVTYVVPRKTGGIRMGITTSRKIGCAVERNRARRIVKAAAVELLKDADGCFDVIFVCRAATASRKSTALYGILKGHLKNAGVLND
ncbi:MAG: ribonuclease P protein component [Ruminococcaceae bacterium]|jgi:ribonuclease P protein component|nr:ribonuclease P protein component [Oscillospiraceae bacterium]